MSGFGRNMKSRLNTIREITVEGMALGGEGQGMMDGRPVYVFNGLPGERVRARVIETNRNLSRAEALRILVASPDRVAPVCPAYGTCSGCNLMHLAYPGQLEYKRQLVLRALRQIGAFSRIPVLPCRPSAERFGYRNKVQVPVRAAGPLVKIGFFIRGSRQVIALDACPVHCLEGNQAFAEIKRLVHELGIPGYDEAKQSGILRHVLVRTARHRGESLVGLVTAEKADKRLRTLAERLMGQLPQIKGVVQNYNPNPGNIILGRETLPLAGQPFVVEEAEGLQFRITAPSFFQINTRQIPVMYGLLRDYLGDAAKGTILDAYCGVGIFSLMLSRTAQAVVGIESGAEAIGDARENAALNQINNTRFVAGRVERIMGQVEKCDGVVLNPPRDGCEPTVLFALEKMRPSHIVYVSCNPATLAKDLKILAKSYRIEKVQPVDLFPQTGHMESIVGLTRRGIRK